MRKYFIKGICNVVNIMMCASPRMIKIKMAQCCCRAPNVRKKWLLFSLLLIGLICVKNHLSLHTLYIPAKQAPGGIKYHKY